MNRTVRDDNEFRPITISEPAQAGQGERVMITDKDLISKARGMSNHLSYDAELKSSVRELCYRLESHVAGRFYIASRQKIMIFGKVRWIKSNGQSRYLTFSERIRLLITKTDPDGIKHSPKLIRLKRCASCAWGDGQYCCNDGTDRRADEIKESNNG